MEAALLSETAAQPRNGAAGTSGRRGGSLKPRVSIIIPTYNRARLLLLAVESALSQSWTDFELLILDDASTDDTAERVSERVKDPRVRFIRYPRNVGITASRNYGLLIARGDYVAMLDSDDVWLDRRKLERQVEFLEARPGYGLVGTFAKILDKDGEVTGSFGTHTEDPAIRRHLLLRNPIMQSSVLIRREALDQVGGYDAAIPVWEDYDLWLRIGRTFKLHVIGEPLTGYRDHGGNISKVSERKSLRSYWMIYRRHRKAYPFATVLLLKTCLKALLYSVRHPVAAASLSPGA